MDYIKKSIWGPDPKEQHRKIKSILRKNSRTMDKSLREMAVLQNKTQLLTKRAAKKNDIKTVKLYARELYRINKQYSRIYTSKAQLESIGMKIDEAFKMNIISNRMGESAGLMREINQMVRLPQLQNTMIELEKELLKSGLITEMIDDTMDGINDMDEELDEEVDAEVNKIVEQYASKELDKVSVVPNVMPEAELSVPNDKDEVEDDQIDEEADNMISEMRERLKALQN